MKLRIAENLSLPIDAVTEKLAFLGRTGSGKTYAAMKLAELMLEAGAQIVSLDPVGAWHGLRIGGPWNVYIFGGLRGDFPLEPTGGKLMADVVTDRGISAVLDISQFIRSEQVRFASDFIERFFNRKKASPSAVHLFLEECQEFAPQNPGNNEAYMLHHFERLWKLGRGFGIGGSLISQRPQEVNKKVLNQSGTLFVFQMTGPQERKAIGEWTKEHGIDDDIQGLLPTLSIGVPHVWSPTFLKVSKTIEILPKLTADVSMTPKVGARTKEQPLTPIDAQKLEADMAETRERAKADDPKELRKQIAQLQAELKKANTFMANQKPAVEEKRVEVSILTDEDREQLSGIATLLADYASSLNKAALLSEEIRKLCEKVAKNQVPQPQPQRQIQTALSKPGYKITEKRQTPPQVRQPREHSNGNGTLGKAERSILIALAQRSPKPTTRNQVGILAGYSTKSSHLDNMISSLRTKGFIDGPGSSLQITASGVAALGDFQGLPGGQELVNWWLTKLGSAERSILSELVNRYPAKLSRQEVSEVTGYSASSSHLDNSLSRLRTLELIEGRGDGMKASDIFFE